MLLSVCAPLLLSAQVAAAQQVAPAPAGEPAGYRALVEEAKLEYDRGNYVEARALFAKANTLFPNARALRGLGMTSFELRDYGDSAAHLTAALTSQVRPLEGTLRGETERLLERANSFVARLVVTVAPEAAQLLVDGVPTTRGPGNALVLEGGNHVLELRADGHIPEKRVIKVIGGEVEQLHVVLARDLASVQPLAVAPAPQTESAPRKRLYKNPWLWTGVGVVTAAAAAGLAVGLSSGGGTARPLVDDAFVTAAVR